MSFSIREAGGEAKEEPTWKSRSIIRGENMPFKEIIPQFITCKREILTKGICYAYEPRNGRKEDEVHWC